MTTAQFDSRIVTATLRIFGMFPTLQMGKNITAQTLSISLCHARPPPAPPFGVPLLLNLSQYPRVTAAYMAFVYHYSHPKWTPSHHHSTTPLHRLILPTTAPFMTPNTPLSPTTPALTTHKRLKPNTPPLLAPTPYSPQPPTTGCFLHAKQPSPPCSHNPPYKSSSYRPHLPIFLPAPTPHPSRPNRPTPHPPRSYRPFSSRLPTSSVKNLNDKKHLSLQLALIRFFNFFPDIVITKSKRLPLRRKKL